MKIITDGFKAMDAMEYAKKESCTFIVKANTITAKQLFTPKLAIFQIRTKNIDANTLDYIKTNFLT